MTGKIRIIGGQWRGRKLAVPERPGLRPSGDRGRETLFNWLQADLVGARCLDLFAGSGALGLEAASRGASRVVLVERDRQLVENLQAVSRDWPGGQVLEVVRDDALAWMGRSGELFDIVFVDPPFVDGLQTEVLEGLFRGGLVRDQGLVYVERGINDPAAISPDDARFRIEKQKRVGRVSMTLLRFQGA